MGCGGSMVERRTRTVWGAKSTSVGQFVPFLQGRTADVKALKVAALIEEMHNLDSFRGRTP